LREVLPGQTSDGDQDSRGLAEKPASVRVRRK
jgi:hypothetical protein